MATELEKFFISLGLQIDSKGFAKARGALNGISSLYKSIAGLGAMYLGSKAIQSVTTDIAKLGGGIADTAKAFGLTTNDLQRLDYAAERSGSSVETMHMAIMQLSKRISDAREGNETATETFRKYGVTLSELANKNPSEQFKLVAQAISEIKDPIRQTAASMEIFGKSGAQLLPLLKDGSKGINDLGNRLEKLGGVLNDTDIAMADNLDDTFLDLSKAALGLKLVIARMLLPPLQAFSNFLLNIPRSGFNSYIQKMIAVMKVLAVTAAIVALNMGINALFAFVAAKGSIVALTAALWKFLVPLAATAITTLLPIAVIALLVVAIQDMYTYLKGGDSYFGDFINWLDRLAKSGNRVAQVFHSLFSDIGPMIYNKIAQYKDLMKVQKAVGMNSPMAAIASLGRVGPNIGIANPNMPISRAGMTKANISNSISVNVQSQATDSKAVAKDVTRAVADELMPMLPQTASASGVL